MTLLITNVDSDTGARTAVGRIAAINFRRDRSATVDVALYVDLTALNAGKQPSDVVSVTLDGAVLASLQAQMEPAVELAVMTTPTFSTATQA